MDLSQLPQRSELLDAYDSYLFGSGHITIQDAPMGVFRGHIGDTGWGLDLNGSMNYGYPNVARFEGKGVVGGEGLPGRTA